MSASVVSGLEVLIGVDGKEEWIKKENVVVEDKIVWARSVGNGLQECVPHARRKGGDLQGICLRF